MFQFTNLPQLLTSLHSHTTHLSPPPKAHQTLLAHSSPLHCSITPHLSTLSPHTPFSHPPPKAHKTLLSPSPYHPLPHCTLSPGSTHSPHNVSTLAHRAGITSVFNVQQRGEHAHCGPGLDPSSGFTYATELFMEHKSEWRQLTSSKHGKCMSSLVRSSL